MTIAARPTVSHRRRRPAAPRGERGATLILMAFSLVSVLVLATLAIDGSQAYTQRRSMQNAADAAAMAATRALDKVRLADHSWTTVADTAEQTAARNGASRSTCTIVDPHGADIGSCRTHAVVMSAAANGVRVVAAQDRQTTFGSLIDVEKVTARAKATATVQALAAAAAPFVICGNPELGGYPILGPDGTIDAASARSMGVIDAQGSQVPTCGAGSAFKGKIGDDEVTVPGWVDADNGNGYEQDIAVSVLNTTPCPSGGPFDGCDMVLPIADRGTGNGSSIQMHVVAWAVFHITGDGHGNPKYRAEFRAEATYVDGGRTTRGTVDDPATPRAIRLIE